MPTSNWPKGQRIKIVDSYASNSIEHRLFAIAYEPVWQRIRWECGLKELDDARATFARLEAYVQNVPRENEAEAWIRYWRATNFLNAVPVNKVNIYGFRLVPRSVTHLLRPFRTSLYERMFQLTPPETWDWKEVWLSCIQMWKDDESAIFLTRLWRRLLAHRAGRGPKPELRYFLHIIEETKPND